MVAVFKYSSLVAVGLLSLAAYAQDQPTTMQTSISGAAAASTADPAAASTGAPAAASTGDGSSASASASASASSAGSPAAASTPTDSPSPMGTPGAATSTPAGSPAAATTSPSGGDGGDSPTPSSASPSPASTPSADGALTGPCSQEGVYNCLGATSFQRCASGQWSVVIPMPAGTQCQQGQSQTLWAAGRRARRHVRRD